MNPSPENVDDTFAHPPTGIHSRRTQLGFKLGPCGGHRDASYTQLLEPLWTLELCRCGS